MISRWGNGRLFGGMYIIHFTLDSFSSRILMAEFGEQAENISGEGNWEPGR